MNKLIEIFTGLTRYFILLLIVAFTGISIFISEINRDIDNPIIKDTIAYAARFEDSFFDSRMSAQFKKHDNPPQDKAIALADIDDESLQAIGRWPWSRSKWTQFIQVMKKAGAKVLAFDVIFSEPELACNAASPDDEFAEAIKDFQAEEGKKVILPYTMADYGEIGVKEVPDTLLNYMIDTKQQGNTNLTPQKISSQTFPIQTLLKADPGLGYINMHEDDDGVFRHYAAVSNVDTLYFGSLGLAAYQAYSGKSIRADIFGDGGASLVVDGGQIALNSSGETKIRYAGDESLYPKLNFKAILNDKTPLALLQETFKDRIVFIGSTAIGAHDIRNTPIDSTLPGVYVHMNFVSMLLNKYFFQPMDKTLLYSYYMLFGGALLLILIQLIGNSYLDIIMLILVVLTSYFLDDRYFMPHGYEIKLFFCYLCYLAIYSWNTFLNFSKANQEKKQIRGAFSRYVAPAIVNQMLANPDQLKVGGVKQDITCIFSDVRDFTSISEKLTATQLSQCLNQYMGRMTDILFETLGTLDKYIGDAIVGYWGAPLPLENHAYHAVRGAVQMVEALPAINEEFKSKGFPEFKIGIGLNSGECSVGNMGSDKIFSYTALGDNMNLGSRLESLCKYYGVQIHISEFTFNAISADKKGEFTFRPLDIVKVKGKEKPVKTYEVLHAFHPFKLDPDSLKKYLNAYEAYLSRGFQEAYDLCAQLLEKYPEDKPTKLLKAHCEECLAHPPGEGWDGVTTHKEK